jgi:RNA polymerase sigma factor (sigma-70 family)
VTVNDPYPSLNTCWTLLLQAHSEDHASREKAWEWFTTRYRRPIVAFFRAYGVSAAEADDLTQDFFADLFRRESLSRVKREGGRFRSWLYASLTNRAVDGFRKRTHHAEGSTIDDPDQRVASRPDAAFERAWSTTVLEQALTALEAGYSGSEGRRKLFRCFLDHALGEPSSETFAAIARRVGMNHGSVRNAHAVFKEQLRKHLRAAVAATVASEEEIDGEIAFLRRALAQ